jgi:hypothetical protein
MEASEAKTMETKPKKKSAKSAATTEVGTSEHLGSDRPYEGEEWTPPETDAREAQPSGDPNAPVGSPEHLGSDRPYEGAPFGGPK